MLLLSSRIDGWLGESHSEPQIAFLTGIFFFLNFLAATQDIAVDGWALTMLKKQNVGYASTCNSVGQTAGYCFGYVLFLALESAEFCNNFLRTTPSNVGLVTLSGFFFFWGCIFLLTTTIVVVFKSEIENDSKGKINEVYASRSLKTAYSFLWSIVQLPSIKTLAVVLLTCKVL